MRRKRIETKRRAQAAAEAAANQGETGIEMKTNPMSSKGQAARSDKKTSTLTPAEKKAALARHKALSKPILGKKKNSKNKEMEAHVGNLRAVSSFFSVVFFCLPCRSHNKRTHMHIFSDIIPANVLTCPPYFLKCYRWSVLKNDPNFPSGSHCLAKILTRACTKKWAIYSSLSSCCPKVWLTPDLLGLVAVSQI